MLTPTYTPPVILMDTGKIAAVRATFPSSCGGLQETKSGEIGENSGNFFGKVFWPWGRMYTIKIKVVKLLNQSGLGF